MLDSEQAGRRGRRRLGGAATALLAGALAATGAGAGGMGSIRLDQPFPDLVLPSAEDGRPMRLGDFRGRKVVLHVFASW